MLYLGKIRTQYEKFSALDAVVLAISPAKLEATKRYKQKRELNFPMLVDEDSAVTIRYDLLNEWEPIRNKVPHPATYVIDKQGAVRFAEVRQHYVFRTKIKTILEELKKLDAK